MYSLKALRFTQADLPSFLNSMLGQIIGGWTAATITRLVRSVGAEWRVRRLQKATWREVLALAQGARPGAHDHAYVLRTMDRIALLTPRLGKIVSALVELHLVLFPSARMPEIRDAVQ